MSGSLEVIGFFAINCLLPQRISAPVRNYHTKSSYLPTCDKSPGSCVIPHGIFCGLLPQKHYVRPALRVPRLSKSPGLRTPPLSLSMGNIPARSSNRQRLEVWLWPAPHSEATMGTLRDRGRNRNRFLKTLHWPPQFPKPIPTPIPTPTPNSFRTSLPNPSTAPRNGRARGFICN
jgi:hypothetical protein